MGSVGDSGSSCNGDGCCAYLGYRHAERVADRRNEHERQLATDARVQQRLADAYVEVLEVVQRVGQWAEMVRPMMDTNPPRELPPIPSLPEQARAEALICAFASNEVRELMTAWRGVVNEIRRADMMIGWGSAEPASGIDTAEQWRKLGLELRPAESAAREALAQRVAMELGHRSGQDGAQGGVEPQV